MVVRVPVRGTRMKCASQVAPVSLKRENVGRGKERIEIYLQATA